MTCMKKRCLVLASCLTRCPQNYNEMNKIFPPKRQRLEKSPKQTNIKLCVGSFFFLSIKHLTPPQIYLVTLWRGTDP